LGEGSGPSISLLLKAGGRHRLNAARATGRRRDDVLRNPSHTAIRGYIDILWDVTYDWNVRVVVDTSVVVAGLRSRLGASNRVLLGIAEQRLTPLVTTAVFLEYEAVLRRAEQRLATGMSEADIDGFLRAFAAAAEPVEISFRWRPQLRDPADELMLEAAVNGHADAVVTHNVSDFAPASARLGVPVLTPAQLLKELSKP